MYTFKSTVNVIPAILCIYKAVNCYAICAFLSCSSGEPPLYMRVTYDFTARNRQELSVMRGDVVQVRSTAEKAYMLESFTPVHFFINPSDCIK